MLNICFFETERAFPVAVWLRPGTITLCTFFTVHGEDAGEQIDADSLAALVCSTPPKTSAPHSPPHRWFDGEVLSAGQKGRKFAVRSHVAFDVAALGPEIVMDQSTIAVLTADTGEILAPVNRTLMKSRGLLGLGSSSDDPRKLAFMLVRVDFMSLGWPGAQFILHGKKAQGVLVFDENKQRVELPDWTEAFRKEEATLKALRTGSVPAGQETAITIECLDPDGSIRTDASASLYAEAISGFVPKTQVSMRNGLANLNAIALGLKAGDTLDLRVGWKVNRGLLSISIPVV